MFAFRVQVGNPGTLRFVVRHAATPSQVAFRAKDRKVQVVSWSAGAGSRASRAAAPAPAFSLGFATPVTGYFDSATARAVTAFRKTNGMGTHGLRGRTVYAQAPARPGRLQAALPEGGQERQARGVRLVAPGAGPRPEAASPTACTTRHRASPPRPRSSAPSTSTQDPGHQRARAWSTRATSSAATPSTATRRSRPSPPATAASGCRSRTRVDLRLDRARRPDLRLSVGPVLADQRSGCAPPFRPQCLGGAPVAAGAALLGHHVGQHPEPAAVDEQREQ